MRFICIHGVPERILTDQGKNFQSVLLATLWDLLDVFQLRTSPYHPECDGQTERFNRTFVAMLRAYVNECHSNWDEFLDLMLFAYRTSVHKTTGMTPYEVIFGRQPKLPSDLFDSSMPAQLDLDPASYAVDVQNKLIRIFELVRSNSDVNVNKFKFYHDRNIRSQSYEVGDYVKKLNVTNSTGLTKKLLPKFVGPYEILEKIGEVDYVIRLASKPRARKTTVHVNRLRRCIRTETRM